MQKGIKQASVFAESNYDGNSKNSAIDVTLDLKLWCKPSFDNMKLVEKLGRRINDMKL